jgi:squalene cyclase
MSIPSVEALRRKLRAVAAMAQDPAATNHERANAKALTARLQRRLREAGLPAGDWTDNVFRLGRWAKEMKKSTSPKGDWTDNARRLGKVLRRGYKSWLSD